mgnify:CR=1 FL=1|jgi:F-type H+-transporting ATPase subunit b
MKLFFVITIAIVAIQKNLFSAEAGMPQLNPEYWASQIFWLTLIFSFLYLAISKIFIPKIRNNLEDRENKIKNDLNEAKNLKENAEKKQLEYEKTIEEAKKEVQKILFDSKNKLDLDIQSKKKIFEKEIELEISKAQKEIQKFKIDSKNDGLKISEEIASKIIEEISGDKLNESSVKAAISEVSKKNNNNYL